MPQKDNLIPSSSLMLVRDSNNGVEVFLMKRAQKSNFGGVWVFPGGILENQDRLMATKDYCNGISETEAQKVLNSNSDSLPYWIASLRETFEETGALIANRNDNSHFIPTTKESESLIDLRSDLLNGKIAFDSILKGLALKMALDRLVYVSHWITPKVETKRYTTRFFLTAFNEDHSLTHDGIEGTDSKWIGVEDALRANEDGSISLIMPTIKNLESILNYDNTTDLMHAKTKVKSGDIPAIEPKFFIEDGHWKGLLPGEKGYEDH